MTVRNSIMPIARMVKPYISHFLMVWVYMVYILRLCLVYKHILGVSTQNAKQKIESNNTVNRKYGSKSIKHIGGQTSCFLSFS